MSERDWDTEWCWIYCELCDESVRGGVGEHMRRLGHLPIVGKAPVRVSIEHVASARKVKV